MNVNKERIGEIRKRLESALQPSKLEIADESHEHIGHVGAKSGKGHFLITIVSDRFVGLNPVQRHRLIYDAIGDLMDSDIHALRIEASPPAAP